MRTISLVALFMFLFSASPALLAAEGKEFREFSLMAGFQSDLIKDGAFDYYSGEDWLTAGTIAGEVEVWNELFVQLGIAMTSSRSQLFGQWDTQLVVNEPRLGVRYGYTFLNFVRPYASAALSYAFVSSRIDLWGTQAAGFADGWLDGELGGRFAAGCELFLPRSAFGSHRRGLFKDFTFGLGLELGYHLRQEVDLDRTTHGHNGDLEKNPPIPGGELALGSLDLSAFFLSFDFRIYF